VAAGGGSGGLLLAADPPPPPGAVVVVADPVMPGFLDPLPEVGYRVLGVASDDRGGLPDALAEALRHDPAVVVLQPEGAYATAGTLTEGRAAELAEVFAAAPTRPWIDGDGAVGPLASAQPRSRGGVSPGRCVRARRYSKA